MDCKEVFKQLVRYIPVGEDARLYNNMRAFGEACLAAGEFDEAANYADILLAQDKNENRRIAACRIRLFAKLRCRSNEEFRHCEAFSKEMPEYLELLAACESEAASSKLTAILKLANENVENVAEQKRRREEEKRREEEMRFAAFEKMRLRQAQIEEEKRREEEMRLRQAQIEEEKRREEEMQFAAFEKMRFLYSLACWGCFTFATLFFVAGIVLWSVFGDRMPYIFAGLGWLFVVALILYVAVFVFAGKKRRAERQQEDIDGSYVVSIVGIVALMVVCIVAGILGAIFQ